MRILVHMHAFNDAEVIDRSLQALRDQTYPIEEILLVDNDSTDGTLRRSLPRHVTVIHHPKNLGPSGAVATGFRYALQQGYDWVWVLDADSIVNVDALEKLVDLNRSLRDEPLHMIGALSSRIILGPNQEPVDYGLLTAKGPRPAYIDPDKPYYECDAAIWSGSLFNLQAVQQVGFPRYGAAGYWEDFCLDWGDLEFFHRLRRANYKLLVHKSSFIQHSVGSQKQIFRFGRTMSSTNHPAFRRYFFFRNMVYFWLYIYPNGHFLSIILHLATQLVIENVKILMLEENAKSKITASLRGTWDGLRKNLRDRY